MNSAANWIPDGGRGGPGRPVFGGTLGVLIAALAISAAACAEATVEDGDTGATADAGGDTADAARDTRPDPTVDTAPDTRPIDTGQPDTAPPDLGQPDLVGECEPFSVRCTEDLTGVRRCSADGAWFDPVGCGAEQVCEEGDGGAECVPCTPGENCPEEVQVCEPNEAFCSDFQTAAVCTADGQVGTESGCGTGRCFGGGCSTVGHETGEACTVNEGTDGCKGRTCLCGSDHTATSGSALCGSDMSAGFCTTADCHENGCDPDTEVCADFSLSGQWGGGHYCVLREDCVERLASCAEPHRGTDFVCRELPSADWTETQRSWGLGCWVPPPSDSTLPCADDNCLAPISGACTDDSECVGGLCLTEAGTSYCTAPCDVTQTCPSYAACVRPDSGSDVHFCLALATPSDCPRMRDSPFEIGAANLPRLGGTSSAQVCWIVGD
jgi:hypothetical protein